MADKIFEIRWHGRGGQGAVTAARIVAGAAYLQGFRGVTAAPSFGAERRGVPVSASTRISHASIQLLSQVLEPDIVVILDQTLLVYDEVTSGLVKNGWLIVNSPRNPAEVGLDGKYNIATADASLICNELGLVVAGLTLVNTAILGAFVCATGLVSLANIERVLKEKFPGKAVDINLAAMRRTYDITRVNRRGQDGDAGL